jgi:hypothetical protein
VKSVTRWSTLHSVQVESRRKSEQLVSVVTRPAFARMVGDTAKRSRDTRAPTVPKSLRVMT